MHKAVLRCRAPVRSAHAVDGATARGPQPRLVGLRAAAGGRAVVVSEHMESTQSMEPRLRDIVQDLSASGDDVLVLTADPKAPARICGAEVVSLHASPPPPPHSPELLRLAALCACVVSRLAASKPHAIHVAGPGLASTAATLYGRLRGVPVVDHGPDTGRLDLGGLLRLLWSVLAGAVALALWHLDYARHLRGQEQLMLAGADA